MLSKLLSSFALAVASALSLTPSLQAAEINFLCANALKPIMDVLIPEFQKESGHSVKVSYGLIGALTDQVRKGDTADLATISPQQWAALQKEGKLGPARATIAKVGIGVYVTKGAPKPDVSSVDAFKQALLNARKIAMPVAPNNPVAVYAMGLMDRLGIAAEVKAKNLVIPGQSLLQAVAKGDAEIGFTQISEVIAAPGVDFLGPLPAEIQNYTVYTTAYPLTAKEPAATKTFVDFLLSPRAAAVFKSKGMEQD